MKVLHGRDMKVCHSLDPLNPLLRTPPPILQHAGAKILIGKSAQWPNLQYLFAQSNPPWPPLSPSLYPPMGLENFIDSMEYIK